MQDLHVEVKPATDRTVVRLRGDAGATQSAAMDRQFRELIVRHPGTVIVDLAGLTFISSVGVSMLAMLHQGLSAQGGQVRLAGGTAAVRSVIEKCRLTDVLPLFDSVESAMG